MASQIDGSPKASPAWIVKCEFSRWRYSNASRWRVGREAGLGAGDVEAGHAAVAPRDGQLGDLHRPGLVPHRGQQLAYDDPAAARGHPRVEALLHRRDDLVERQPARDVLLGGVAHLGVDDAVRGEVLDALAGDPGDRRTVLHDGDGVVEGLEVADERPGVGRLGEPAPQRRRVGGRELVADLGGQLDDRLRSQAAVEVVVQQHLRGAVDLVTGRSAHRHIQALPAPGLCSAPCAPSPRSTTSPRLPARRSAPASGSRSTRPGSTPSPTPPSTTSGSTSTSSRRPPGRSARRSRTGS